MLNESFLLGYGAGKANGGGGGDVTLITKTITENGAYDAEDDNADGYSSVTVDVPPSGYVASDWVDPTKPVGAIVSDVVSPVSVMRRTGITSITLNEATVLPNSFAYNATGLTAFSAPKVETIGTYCFSGCTALTSVNLPLLTEVSDHAFSGCTSLGSCKFQSATQIMGYAFDNCKCEALVFPSLVRFGAKHALDTWKGKYFDCLGLTRMEYTFGTGTTNLQVLIIRSTTVQANPYGLPDGIVVYVPSSLKSTYETATNWSSWLARSPNNSFAAIEGSIYETQYADGTPIS